MYYTSQRDDFAFASELRSLLPLVRTPRIDLTRLADYLTFLWVPDPKTAFVDIRKLPPGHYAWASLDGIETHQYWDLQFRSEERGEEEWKRLVAEAVTRCVQRQMVSDVPLGASLSEGVDSSAIVPAMSTQSEDVNTYTVDVHPEDLRHEIVPDDLRYAREVARVFDTRYAECVLQPDVLSLLPKAVWHLEGPVADPAAISTFLICREASSRMPVMLSGAGGDEVFAGYPRYLAYQISRSLDRIPRPLVQALGQTVALAAKPGRPGRLRGPRRNLWKFMRGAGLLPLEHFLAFSSYYTAQERERLLLPEFAADLDGYDPLDRHREYFDVVSGQDELSRLLYLDAKTFLPCLNLTYTDKMAMATSVEVRVPLLDDELVDLTLCIPSRLKVRHLRRKYIFKRSQESVLPRHIVWRRKAGFGAPIRSWLSGELAPLESELLAEGTLARHGIVNPSVVAGMREDNTLGRADYSLQLYAFLNLELCFRTFTDRAWRFDAPVAPTTTAPV